MSYVCYCLDAEDHFTSGCARLAVEWREKNPPSPPQPPARSPYVQACGCIDAEQHYVLKMCRLKLPL